MHHTSYTIETRSVEARKDQRDIWQNYCKIIQVHAKKFKFF